MEARLLFLCPLPFSPSLLQHVKRVELRPQVVVCGLEGEVALQVDAVVLLQGVVGDLEVALKLEALLRHLGREMEESGQIQKKFLLMLKCDHPL